MDIKRSCALSPFIDNNKPIISTLQKRPPSSFPFESNTDSIDVLNSTPIMNVHTSEKSDLLDEQFRLERDIAEQSSIKTQDSFKTTYSSLQTMLSQMQLKVAAAFLQETEYLQQREQRLEYEEQFLIERQKHLENLRYERERIEEDFIQIKDRLGTAVIQLEQFKTDGVNFILYFSILIN